MIILMVFEERKDHQEFETPQRHSLYIGKDPETAFNKFKDIENGQVVMVGEYSKITLVKKNNEILID